MSISDAIYRPFETLIRPLDIPYRPLPSKGPVAVLLHFISMFRGVLIALALSSMAIEAINLTIVWGLSVIVDGVTQQGASAFLRNEWPLLTFLGLLIFPAMPVASFLRQYAQFAYARHGHAGRHPVAGSQGSRAAGSRLLP